MNAELREAVENIGLALRGAWGQRAAVHADWLKVLRALRDQEAENAAQATELRTLRGEYAKEFKRAEKAEALLRECVENREGLAYETDLLARITAHLGGEHD